MHYMFASLLIVYYEYYFQIIDKTYMIYLSYVYVKKTFRILLINCDRQVRK